MSKANPKSDTELDVRKIPPPEKHPRIFQQFEELAEGEDFVLVNDHDPKPLYYQFLAERNGTFSWVYEESGTTVWRVRIGKVPPTHPARLNVKNR